MTWQHGFKKIKSLNFHSFVNCNTVTGCNMWTVEQLMKIHKKILNICYKGLCNIPILDYYSLQSILEIIFFYI